MSHPTGSSCPVFEEYAFFPQLFPASTTPCSVDNTGMITAFAEAVAARTALDGFPKIDAFSVGSSLSADGTLTQDQFYCLEDIPGLAANPGPLGPTLAGTVLVSDPTSAACDGTYILIDNAQPEDFFGEGYSPPFVATQTLGCFADYIVPVSDETSGDAWADKQNWGALRAFPFVNVDPAMTFSQCSAIAAAAMSPFFGLEKGSECWYGDATTVLTQIMRFKEAADPSSCSHMCSDGSACGGEYFMTLYLTPQVGTTSCFPAEATVEVQGKGTVSMEQLKYGDKVAGVDRSTGQLSWNEVYMFSHRDAAIYQTYVTLTTAFAKLQMTPMHFIPTCVADCAGASPVMQYKYSRDLAVGDLVLSTTSINAPAQLTPVTRVWTEIARGAFNPYVRGADMIVDGVVASPHSDWILDPVTPEAMRHMLPAVYEALFAPISALFAVIGPTAAEWIAHGPLGLANAGAGDSGAAVYVGLCTSMAAPAALLLWGLAKASKKTAL
ncbi:MAG: hypothetical protein WDW38_009132 [Sanguina aurantia]